MKVSIVAAYNNELEMTKKFVKTMKDTTKDFKGQVVLILVNGGNEVDLKEDVDIFVKLESNEGFCKTLNQGLKAIPEDTDYVFFVGNDSFPVNDTWLQDLINLQKKTGAWMVCPANDRPGMKAYEHLYMEDFGDYWDVNFFPSIAWLMPMDKFQKIGLLDENYIRTGMYADNDYCRRIKIKDGLIIVSKKILLRHLLSIEGRRLGTQGVDMNVNNDYFIKKWGG